MLDTLHVVSTECPHATYVAHHMPQHCCMPCSDAHLPVSLHKPIRTAAVAQISATSGALNSVQPLALSIQCNFWHSQFSATSGTLNSVQLLALSIQCNFLHSQPAVSTWPQTVNDTCTFCYRAVSAPPPDPFVAALDPLPMKYANR